MTIYHVHHIIPRHAGGSDDPSNLVRLTIEDHAEEHRKLYEKYGRPQDYAAWKGLSGMMCKAEIIRHLQSECSKISNAKRIEDGTHNFLGYKNPSAKLAREGSHHFQLNVGNRPGDIAQRKLVEEGKHYFQSEKHSLEVSKRTKRAILEKNHPSGTTIECPYCGKVGQTTAMKRWHFNNCKKSIPAHVC